MAHSRVLTSLIAFSLLLLLMLSGFATAEADYNDKHVPAFTHGHEKRANYGSGAPYWMSQIKRQGKVAYGANSSYILWRNVRDYGAKGDGITDDTDAINNATADGFRCGLGCDSSTTTPAIIYFPPGTYMVSAPLIMYYYTQFIGDANDLPTLKAFANFQGIGVLDSDKYLPFGFSWYTNQNNFYRQVRNLVIDITSLPKGRGACIHWQVAQATSLQNIVMNMVQGTPGDGNAQQGIFMDNGSGGWMEDLIFNGGGIGFFSGNQQFTSRNLTFNGCETAIYQNWDWIWNYKSLTINNCNIGLDMTQGGSVITTGSIVVQDGVFNNVNTGILTTFSSNSTPVAGGTLVVDNVDFTGTKNAIAYPNGTVIQPGGSVVSSFLQGRVYTAYEAQQQFGNLTCWEPTANSARIQQSVSPPPKSQSLLTASGTIYERSKPQYEGMPVASFISILDYGCKGDGVSDDTACVQAYFDSIATNQIAYIDHGAYVVTKTVQVPKNIRMVGEIWPLFMIQDIGLWSDKSNPKPAFRVGNPGDVGTVEMQDIVFETRGPAPGAIMVEWNLAGSTPGAAAMWDVHWRIGGTNGTLLQSDRCSKTPTVAHTANTACIGAFLLLHVTHSGSVYMANNWGWVADHELDLTDHNQIDIYNGRGVLIESQGPVWLYGTSFEHSMLYNYQIANAKEIYMGIIQSETAYMQDDPNALTPFPPNAAYSDPTFSNCFIATCYKTYGLRIFNSTYIFNYGAGLYSFFNNYDQGCLLTESCQENMVAVVESEGIYLYALTTKASTNQVTVDDVAIVPEAANVNGFGQTLAVFEYP
ncbi:hypothetical protein LTR66_002539 [Elasticomyces elasticus]|nr:hypothetical protein LTR66_002539 [Elasticomyces elasticus]